jgi:putative transposase
MQIQSAYKFRLYPNKEQEDKLAGQFGATRFVYNHFLRQRIDHYAETGQGLTYHDTAVALTELKKQAEYTWLNDADSQALQQSLRDLDVAYNNFFNKRGAFPKFKTKDDKQFFRVPQRFKIKDNRLYVPKVGWVKVVAHRPIEGSMKNLTVSRTQSGKYFASIQVEREIPEPTYEGDVIGLDLGLTDFAVTSDGQHFPHPQHLSQAEKRLKRLQRKVSRCQKGSKGREKARQALARQHEKVANQRKDFQHKLSRTLVEENRSIAVEDLNVKGMTANHHLAKHIADAGWSEFLRQLDYKGTWYGCEIERLEKFFPSSKRCHVCGYINQDLTLSVRHWQCPQCLTDHDRDENAAKNIEIFTTAGTAGSYAGGETVRP